MYGKNTLAYNKDVLIKIYQTFLICVGLSNIWDKNLEKNFNYVKDHRVSNPRYIVLAISSAKDA